MCKVESSQYERELYLETVKIAREILSDIVSTKGEQCLEKIEEKAFGEWYHPIFMLVEENAYDENKKISSRQLKKMVSEGIPMSINKEVEIINAIYVPAHIDKILFWFNEKCVEYIIRKEDEKTMEEILVESKTIPTSFGIRELLRESKSTRVGYRHKGEERVTIEGVEYVRIEPFKPFLPRTCLVYVDMKMCISDECDVYLEMISLHHDKRTKLSMKKHMIQFNGALCEIKGGLIDLERVPCSIQNFISFIEDEKKPKRVIELPKTYKDTNFSFI